MVYPEKVKAALDLHSLAAKLFMDIPAYFVGAQDRQRAMELQADAGVMLWRAKSYEFLLGEEVVRLTREYRMICITVFLYEREFRPRDVPPVSQGDVWAHEASYKELSNALRRTLNLDTLDGLLLTFDKSADRPKPLLRATQSQAQRLSAPVSLSIEDLVDLDELVVIGLEANKTWYRFAKRQVRPVAESCARSLGKQT